MPTNWPPPSAPSWPPPEVGSSWFSCSDLRVLVKEMIHLGFTRAAPTAAEQTAYFPSSVRCDENHQVVGQMIVSPSNVRYPFAVCNNAAHRALLCLWPPYEMGVRSGIET